MGQGETLALPIGLGVGTKVATIIISATDGGDVNESGQFMASNTKIVLVAGTANLKAESADGNLCLVPGNQTQLINHLGTDVDVVVTMFWN